MSRTGKWFGLTALATLGSLVVRGCFGAFWDGLTLGWPGGSPWWNTALDVVKEATIYRT